MLEVGGRWYKREDGREGKKILFKALCAISLIRNFIA